MPKIKTSLWYGLAGILLLLSRLGVAQTAIPNQPVHFQQNDSLYRVEVYIGGRFFTSYRYGGGELKKPVLFPLTTAGGDTITRGFPLASRPGERVDHPHHYGLWFNHGDVNGFDFWNNSDAIPAGKRQQYGAILHRNIIEMRDGIPGTLTVTKNWTLPSGDTILREQTTYSFSGNEHLRQIDHYTTLIAITEKVVFRDSKEGMFALRVARQLEHPSAEPLILTDSALHPTAAKVFDNVKVSSHYLNSEGLEADSVWGKRARWVKLSGILNTDSVAVVILDHPENPNHPPHWMARGYGLFGVNPFGSKIYSEGKEELNFTLESGQSVSFRHRLLIIEGSDPDREYLEECYREFGRVD